MEEYFTPMFLFFDALFNQYIHLLHNVAWFYDYVLVKIWHFMHKNDYCVHIICVNDLPICLLSKWKKGQELKEMKFLICGIKMQGVTLYFKGFFKGNENGLYVGEIV